jgi:DNA repair protein RadA/Sms
MSKSGETQDGTILLSNVSEKRISHYQTGEWDANFDPRGIPADSVTVLGGAPGAGKSTLALQLIDGVSAQSPYESLYVAAEESDAQIRDRAVRLGLKHISKIRLAPLSTIGDTSLLSLLEGRNFSIVVIDSISGLTDNQAEQVDIVKALKPYAEKYSVPFIILSHITKEGDIAGAMALQHAGDISLMLTKWDEDESGLAHFPDDNNVFKVTEVRRLYTEKSRYGPNYSSEYIMTQSGLKPIELVDNEE